MVESKFENVFRREELQDMYTLGEVKSLEDLYLLEDVALIIKDLNKKKDFYKDYKKKKVQDINDAIKVIDNKTEFYKSIMISTLVSNNEKSVKFPGSCSISSRNQKPKWVINDEEEFIDILKAAKIAGEDVDDVLEKVVQYNIRKTEASKLLEMWEKSGKLDDFLKNSKNNSGDIVQKHPSKMIISIKFLEEKEEEEIGNSLNDIVVPIKDKVSIPSDVEDYDSL